MPGAVEPWACGQLAPNFLDFLCGSPKVIWRWCGFWALFHGEKSSGSQNMQDAKALRWWFHPSPTLQGPVLGVRPCRGLRGHHSVQEWVSPTESIPAFYHFFFSPQAKINFCFGPLTILVFLIRIILNDIFFGNNSNTVYVKYKQMRERFLPKCMNSILQFVIVIYLSFEL